MVIRMRRTALLAVPLTVVALGAPVWAAAQTTPGTTTSGTTPTAGAPTTTTAPAYTGPPKLSALRLRKVVTAQQGHARFMLGMKSAGPITVTARITSVKTKKVVRTIRSAADHPGGAVWFLVQAVNDQGYQLTPGAYTVAVTGTDSRGRSAKRLTTRFTLRLSPPRGRLDGYTVPNLPAIARQLTIPPGGQLVTALGARGALVNAGLRRGDVITTIRNLDVSTPGQWTAALKAIPADAPVPVTYRRGTEVRTATIQVPPDWNPAPDYAKTFTVLVKRNPKALGYLLASARNRIDAGKPDVAQSQFASWPPALQRTAIGQMLQGEVLLAKDDLKGALAAYNRSTKSDPTLAPALLGKGLVLSRLDRTDEAVPAFQAAVASDPGNAIAQAFLAYALITTKQYEPAIAAAAEATRLDPSYEDGPIAHGLALIAMGEKARGVALLKKGLLFMADQKRADTLIAENLEPNA
jgi:Flp pilus assembly protein TadD